MRVRGGSPTLWRRPGEGQVGTEAGLAVVLQDLSPADALPVRPRPAITSSSDRRLGARWDRFRPPRAQNEPRSRRPPPHLLSLGPQQEQRFSLELPSNQERLQSSPRQTQYAVATVVFPLQTSSGFPEPQRVSMRVL